MPYVNELDVALRAYVPAYEQVGAPLPASQVTLSNIDEARRATGLTWEPETEPQYRVRVLGPGQESVEQVAGLKYVTRGTGGRILGSLKSSYHLFSNAELFAVAETIGQAALETGRPVRFLSGGEIDGGRRVFLLADLGVTEIPGDPSPHVRFMTLLSGHNGAGAVKVLGTDMRWRCTNALRAAELEALGKGAAFSFRHSSRIARRIEDSRKAITAALLQHTAIDERTREMLGRPVTAPAASEYLQRFALAQVVAKENPLRVEQAALSKARENAVAALEAELRVVYESPTCDGIRDTAYGPFAAVVEYLDNRRPATSAGSRFDRTMVNTERGKLRAFGMARKLL